METRLWTYCVNFFTLFLYYYYYYYFYYYYYLKYIFVQHDAIDGTYMKKIKHTYVFYYRSVVYCSNIILYCILSCIILIISYHITYYIIVYY